MAAATHQGSRQSASQGRVSAPVRLLIPRQRLATSLTEKDLVDVVKVSEVGVYFHDPVRLDQYNSSDEKSTPPLRQEGLEFHPCNDVV